MRRTLAATLDRLLFGPDEAEEYWRMPSLQPVPTLSTQVPSEKDDVCTSQVPQLTPRPSQSSSASTREECYTAEETENPAIVDTPHRLQELLRRRPKVSWYPTVFQTRALVAVGALIVALACTFLSLTILLVADGQSISSWKIQPNVYLAVITALANSAIALARMEAIPISWWYSASRGRTISSLERQWKVSRSVIQALRYGRYMSFLNVACIACSLVIIDGPLLQRAVGMTRSERPFEVSLEVNLPSELPKGFDGYATRRTYVATDASNHLLAGYLRQDSTMPVEVRGCPETCKATVHGPGVIVTDCDSEVWPITPEMMISPNASWGTWKQGNDSPLGRFVSLPMFSISLRTISTKPKALSALPVIASLEVGLANVSIDGGEYTLSHCHVAAAILEYDVVIESSSHSATTLTVPRHSSQGRFVAVANNTRFPKSAFVDGEKTPILLETTDYTTFIVNLIYSTNSSFYRYFGDPTLPWEPDSSTLTLESYKHQIFGEGIAKFTDPTADIISAYNVLMLRGAALTASWSNLTHLIDKNASVKQTVTGQASLLQVYRSELKWFAGAFVLELVTILSVLPLLWGWWTLGFNATLSPLNIALAFDSPLLKDVNSAAGAGGVVENLGGMRLKFGAVDADDENDGRGDSLRGKGYSTGRLGMGWSQRVVHPRKGAMFRR